MAVVHRILPEHPVVTLDDHLAAGGGVGLAAARGMTPSAVVETVSAAGLRGRGGAGFPTGTKWAAVIEHRSDDIPATVVVNGAEGEPGTFKDRSILRTNPFLALEGALIAAHAVGADSVVVGLKAGFAAEVELLTSAIAELRTARWGDDVEMSVFEGPQAYLLGEETAMLEAIDGRQPMPRIAPPFRRGVEDVVPAGEEAPPALVDNVETLANVAFILASGVDEFRSMGTTDSPGTIVCTVTGAVATPGVAELEMGSPLSELIDAVGGGAIAERTVIAALPGVSNAVIRATDFSTPLTYEAMEGIGSGLGSGGFVVFDDEDDMVAVAAGVSRFLYVESCGQCSPCKQDGEAISAALDDLISGELQVGAARTEAVETIRTRLGTVADGARCALARQHQTVVGSVLDAFPEVVEQHVEITDLRADRTLIAEVVDLHDGITLIDEQILTREPDWATVGADGSPG